MTKKLVVITGASSGIGQATAKLLSEKGHPLLLLATNLAKLKTIKLPNSMCRSVDVRNAKTFFAAVNDAEQKFGPADCIINNAGVMLLSLIENQDPEEWQRMFDINVIGVLNGIQSVIKKMIKKKCGTIINISSVAGRKTFPNHAAYCGSKFAVHAMTENIREESAKHNVRCITIAPGAVETNLLSHTSSQEIKDSYTQWKEDMGGVLKPQDIANAILFAYSQPQNVCVREIVIAATRQEP